MYQKLIIKLSQIKIRVTVHADASYSQGSHVEAPWTANLGASWSF
ncbi:autotransporter outer membrane beta-barrel domain-containing protein [Salmonella enterica subsp. enterica]|nr:autotransporter outer membrane beta-barrel domain-containing protein [Salmonella enterica subsp. enterica serovar Abony]